MLKSLGVQRWVGGRQHFLGTTMALETETSSPRGCSAGTAGTCGVEGVPTCQTAGSRTTHSPGDF